MDRTSDNESHSVKGSNYPNGSKKNDLVNSEEVV